MKPLRHLRNPNACRHSRLDLPAAVSFHGLKSNGVQLQLLLLELP